MNTYIKGNIDHVLGLGTLAANTLISSDNADSVDDSAIVTSVVATWAIDSMTVAEDQGPILVGMAHSDYTDAEIEAYVEQLTGWSKADLISREVSQRKIRTVGILGVVISNGAAFLNDGKPIKTKLNWKLAEGQTIAFWAYNVGGAALSGTAPDIHINGHANIFSD